MVSSLYHSQSLDIALRPDGTLLRVFDPEGNPVPYWFENARTARTARAQEQEIAELRAELERLRRQRPPAPH